MTLTTEEITAAAPADLPTDAAAFWGHPPTALVLTEMNAANEVPVIDRLGAAPFKKPDKGGFPFLGFLASVYEHVSTTARGELHPADPGMAQSESLPQITSIEPTE